MLTKNELWWLTRNAKAIPGQFQHALAVADRDKKNIRNVKRKICTERRKISLLKDVKNRTRFEKVIALVDIAVPNL